MTKENNYKHLKRRLRFWRLAISILILTCVGLPFVGLTIVHLNWPVDAATIGALIGLIISTEAPITILINLVMKHIDNLNKQEYHVLYGKYKEK